MGVVVNLTIGVVIACLPLYIKIANVGDFSRTSKNNLLVLIFGVLCFLIPKKERKLTVPMCLALGYGLISMVLNQWSPASTNVQFQAFYLGAGIIFFAMFYEGHTKLGTALILDGMALGCIIQSVIVIAAIFDLPLYLNLIKLFIAGVRNGGTTIRGIGSLGNPNILASYVALTSVALFRKGWLWLLPLPILALIEAKSEMGYATFMAGAAYFLNLKLNLLNKIWPYALAILAMIVIYFTGAKNLDSQRFEAWGVIFSVVTVKHFIFGMGPGWFADMGIVLNPKEIMYQEHNEFISAFNIYGMIGIGLLAIVFWKFLRVVDEHKLFASVLFAAFVNSYGHFSLHHASTVIIIIVSACICLAGKESDGINLERVSA